jgi:hypothetical protein
VWVPTASASTGTCLLLSRRVRFLVLEKADVWSQFGSAELMWLAVAALTLKASNTSSTFG